MKTKLISLALILMLSASMAIGQSTEKGKTSFAILGGANFQNLTGKDNNGDKLTNDMLTGFHAGFNIQMPVAPDFYFQPGLQYAMKGAQQEMTLTKAASDDNMVIHLSYIEVPLNLLFKPQLGSGHLLLGFGPYVAYGISGKMKYKDNSEDIEFKGKVSETDPDLFYVRPFDAGANIFVGYELPVGLFFHFNTQLGLLNLEPEYEGATDDKTKINNTGFGFSAGFRF